MFVVTDILGTPTSSLSPATGTMAQGQDMSSLSFSRSSEDLSLSDDTPPPLPTSPIPTEPLIPYNTDLSEVQVSRMSSFYVALKENSQSDRRNF